MSPVPDQRSLWSSPLPLSFPSSSANQYVAFVSERFPVEICELVAEHIFMQEIPSLALTCKAMYRMFESLHTKVRLCEGPLRPLRRQLNTLLRQWVQTDAAEPRVLFLQIWQIPDLVRRKKSNLEILWGINTAAVNCGSRKWKNWQNTCVVHQ